jgi:hypothetical protein
MKPNTSKRRSGDVTENLREVISVSHLALLLQVSRVAIYQMIDRNELPCSIEDHGTRKVRTTGSRVFGCAVDDSGQMRSRVNYLRARFPLRINSESVPPVLRSDGIDDERAPTISCGFLVLEMSDESLATFLCVTEPDLSVDRNDRSSNAPTYIMLNALGLIVGLTLALVVLSKPSR